MSDPLQSGNSPARWVQRCPEHKTVLVIDGEQFLCRAAVPGAVPGGHVVEHPEVWDRWKGKIHTEGLPNDTALPKKAPTRQRIVSPRPARQKGAARMPGPRKTVPKAKTETLDRAKYRGPDGAGLFLRLLRVVRKTGDPYHVKWTHATSVSALGQKGTAGGVSATAPSEAAARGEFNKAKAQARDLGWMAIEIAGRGSPRLELKPIPAPRKKPGPKTRGPHAK